jgi:ribonuclease T2
MTHKKRLHEKLLFKFYKTMFHLSVGGRWTTHGLWPSTGHGQGPFECNKTAPFDPDVLNPILSRLEVQWTDVRENGPKDDFWNHEWTKHGTCAMQLEVLNTELKYFSKGKYCQCIK